MAPSNEQILAFSLWWESADGDARTRSVLPRGLEDFVSLKEEYESTAAVSIIEVAFIFTEILMKELGSKSERFVSIDEWLDSLLKYYRAEKPRWRAAIVAFLRSERPVCQLSPAVYCQGARRVEIPSNDADFRRMVDNDPIFFALP